MTTNSLFAAVVMIWMYFFQKFHAEATVQPLVNIAQNPGVVIGAMGTVSGLLENV